MLSDLRVWLFYLLRGGFRRCPFSPLLPSVPPCLRLCREFSV